MIARSGSLIGGVIRPRKQTIRSALMLNFSIRAMFFTTAYLMAVLICLLSLNDEMRLAAISPGIVGCFSAGLIAAAIVLVCFRSDWKSAWPLLTLGWLVACVDINVGVYNSFFVIFSGSPGGLNMIHQRGFNTSMVSGIALPLFFTLPILYPLIYGHRDQLKPFSFVKLMPLLLAITDTLLIWLLASFTCGTWEAPLSG